jgi:antitoxin ParD1/3/4
MTKTLALPADIAAKLDERVASGAAADAVDAVRAGIAALEAEEARKLEAVRDKVARALADPRSSVPADDVFGRLEAMLRSLRP